jgi:Mrp family chromosome partitioning ATPase
VIISSPQELVEIIVEKAIKMTNLMNIKILGLIENMSWLNCPKCNHQIQLFGKTNAKKVAINNKIKLLGKIPFDPKIGELCDKGEIEEYSNEIINSIILDIENQTQNKNNFLN